ncbi:MAG: hypothetical protein K2X87_04010 [Gemmataceae bacterium]|nr:hypothetical protein [Gemmataceae bacterium]
MSIKPLSRKGMKLDPAPKPVDTKKAKKKAKKEATAAEAAARSAAAPAPEPVAVIASAPEPEVVAPPAPEPAPKVKEPRPAKSKQPRYVRPQAEKRAPAAPLPPLFRTNRLTGKLMSKVVPPAPPADDEAAARLPGWVR